jgi:hypothetical protein
MEDRKKEMCEWCGWPLSPNCCLKGREKYRKDVVSKLFPAPEKSQNSVTKSDK